MLVLGVEMVRLIMAGQCHSSVDESGLLSSLAAQFQIHLQDKNSWSGSLYNTFLAGL